MWSLVLKELRSLSRRRLPYLVRLLPALVVLQWLAELNVRGARARSDPDPLELFNTAALLLTLSVAFVLLAWGVPSIAEERERGTLPLLVCSPLSATHIVLAKGLSQLVLAFSIVVAFSGVLAITTTLGGIDPYHLARFHLALGAVTLCALFLALCMSAACSTVQAAIGVAFGFCSLVWGAIPLLVALLCDRGVLPRAVQWVLMPLNAPALLHAAVDPYVYERWIKHVGGAGFAVGIAFHLVAGVALLHIAVRLVESDRLLWGGGGPESAAAAGCRQGTPRQIYWVWLRVWQETIWDRIEGRFDGFWILRRAWLANPYDAELGLGCAACSLAGLATVGGLILEGRFGAIGWVACVVAVLGLLAGVVLPVLGSTLAGVALGLWQLHVGMHDAEAVLFTIALVSATMVSVTAAVGAARDRSSFMLEHLLVTPARSAELALGHLYYALRAALPAVALLCGLLGVLTVMTHLGWRVRHWTPSLWLTPMELMLDLVGVSVLGVVLGLAAGTPRRAMACVAVVLVCCWLVALVAEGDRSLRSAWLTVGTGAVIFVIGTFVRRRRALRVLMLTGSAYVAGTVLLGVLLVVLLHYLFGLSRSWMGCWIVLPINILAESGRSLGGPLVKLLFIGFHAVVAVGLLITYMLTYETLVQRIPDALPRGIRVALGFTSRSDRPLGSTDS